MSENHAENAAKLGVLLDAALKIKYPGASASHPSTAREQLQTYRVSMPARDSFDVFLDAGDALIARNSDDRRVALLIAKIEARLAAPAQQ